MDEEAKPPLQTAKGCDVRAQLVRRREPAFGGFPVPALVKRHAAMLENHVGYAQGELAGLLQLAAGFSIATGRREKTALIVIMAWSAWLMFVCACMANEWSPMELQKRVGFEPTVEWRERHRAARCGN